MANYVKPNSVTIIKEPNKSVYDLKETISLYGQGGGSVKYWSYGPAKNTANLAGYEREPGVPFKVSYSSPGSYVVSCGCGEVNISTGNSTYYFGETTIIVADLSPSSICIPSEIIGGNDITVSWGASTYSDWNVSGYILEYKVDSGAWTQVYKGSSLSATVAIAAGWSSVQFRVKAYSTRANSNYRTSEVYTVIDNHVPAISGSNQNLGVFSDSPPSYSYTVSDADGDTVTVVETLDGTTQRSYTVTLGEENTCTFSNEAWLKVLNGSHTLEIKATDSKGGSATRTLTFTKAVTSISFEQTFAMPADDMPIKALLNIQGSFPAGSILKVEICNNGNDEESTWEDITSKVLQEKKCYFNNTVKTAESWGVKVRASLERGTATEPCYIQTLGGNFG